MYMRIHEILQGRLSSIIAIKIGSNIKRWRNIKEKIREWKKEREKQGQQHPYVMKLFEKKEIMKDTNSHRWTNGQSEL